MEEIPLTEIWGEYTYSLEKTIETGDIDDPIVQEIFIWPRQLELTESEKEDIKRHIHERMAEIQQRHAGIPLDVQQIAGFIFKSLMAGMMLEKQKNVNEDPMDK